MLAIGDYAPTLSIPTDTDIFSIAEQGGKKVVVFFFPRADTPGCTKEAGQFSALHDEFTTQNTLVIGVSKDKPAEQARYLALISNPRGKASLDEIIKITVKNALRIALFNISSQILYHLIRMQNIRPDLVSPANVGFA